MLSIKSDLTVLWQVSLDEGTLPNVKVVQVNATDADAGVNAEITYSLTLAPSRDFYIDSKTGNQLLFLHCLFLKKFMNLVDFVTPDEELKGDFCMFPCKSICQ